jgi:hypothetical protein
MYGVRRLDFWVKAAASRKRAMLSSVDVPLPAMSSSPVRTLEIAGFELQFWVPNQGAGGIRSFVDLHLGGGRRSEAVSEQSWLARFSENLAGLTGNGSRKMSIIQGFRPRKTGSRHQRRRWREQDHLIWATTLEYRPLTIHIPSLWIATAEGL